MGPPNRLRLVPKEEGLRTEKRRPAPRPVRNEVVPKAEIGWKWIWRLASGILCEGIGSLHLRCPVTEIASTIASLGTLVGSTPAIVSANLCTIRPIYLVHSQTPV